MQARAIFEAAANVKKQKGKDVLLEIMVPLVGCQEEMSLIKMSSLRLEMRLELDIMLSLNAKLAL